MWRNNDQEDLIPLSELISLGNRRASITRAAAGICKAIAYRFAEAGAALELADVDEQRLRTVKDELKRFDVEAGGFLSA